MAEHMLLMGVDRARGREDLRRRRLPQRLRQDQLRHADPAGEVPQGRLEDHHRRRRHRLDVRRPDDGRLCAINPEAGYFGVVPGTNYQTNPNAMQIIAARHHLHQRRAAARRRRVVGRQDRRAARRVHRLDRASRGRPDCGRKAAHPNSRFTAPMTNNPVLDPSRRRSRRRADQRPSSSAAAAARRSRWSSRPSTGFTASTSARRSARRRPPPPPARSASSAATRWPCCRSAATTSATTSCTGSACARRMTDCPRIFHVNWFRKDDQGKFLWPGFGENMRVLEWIIDRGHGRAYAVETLLGWMPRGRTSTSKACNSPLKITPPSRPSPTTSSRAKSSARKSSS